MDDFYPGLGAEPRDEWPKITKAEARHKPIDRMRPGSTLHGRVLSYLTDRISHSERSMGQFYSRWRVNEKRVQAYIDLPDYERRLKEINKSGEPAKAVSITVPYSFATMASIVTYLLHVFAGRKPIFTLGTYRKDTVEAAHMLEQLLQHNSDHVRLIKHLFQFFNDGELYGVGVMRTAWRNEKAMRTVFKQEPLPGFLGMFTGQTKSVRTRELRSVFEGTEIFAQDPFMFFPDPRVPMAEVNRRGEYVFWRTFEGKHLLKREEIAGRLKWVDAAGELPRANYSEAGGESDRHLLSAGYAHPGIRPDVTSPMTRNFYQLDQGTIDIIPAELGLSESEKPEKWIFSILNKSQIVQAEQLELDHGMHPVVVAEPYTLGYGFGQPGMSDYLGPVQDTVSWFINSHIHNVRSALNNMFVVDPSMVEMQDLINPEPGKIIRLKRAAYGQDVRQAIQQFAVQDVTNNHVNDMEMIVRLGDSLSGINDNLRGVQDSGGRKTATEVRTSAEAAASRLASHAKLISAQAIVDLAEQMVINAQQFMQEDYYFQILGPDGQAAFQHITPELIVGDFTYPVHDGTLPLDKVATLDVWKEIMMAVAADPELRGTFSLPKIFEWVAELGGAKNLDAFKVNLVPDPMAQAQAQAGNVVPLSPTTGPAARAAGAPTQ